MKKPEILAILGQRHIRLLWLGQLLSAFGDRFFEIAVVWLSVQIVGSEAGFVLAAGAVTQLIVGLLGGVFADRWDRRRTMVAVELLRGLTIFSLPVALFFGEITLLHMAIVAAIEGGLGALFQPALQSSLPNLVGGSRELQATNALFDVTSRMARIFAPGLAGLIIALIPIEQFFTIDAVTFVVSAVALYAIGRNFRWRATDQVNADRSFLAGVVQDIAGAFALVRENRPVFWSLMSYVPANVVWAGGIMVGLALLADEVFDAGVQGYSFLITAYGIGSVISNLIVGSSEIRNRVRLLFIGVTIFGLGIAWVGLSPTYAFALVGMVIAATGTPMSDLMMLVMLQEEFPADQVGKVYALRVTISSVGYSAGLVLAGWLFQVIPVSVGMTVYGVLLLLIGLLGAWWFWTK